MKKNAPNIMSNEVYEDIAPHFLELASEQRLSIIFRLLEKKGRVSTMAKKLGVTAQEVHRNFDRLVNAGLVKKEKDGLYNITTFGKAICSQIPSLAFLSKNRAYFDEHNFGDLPPKFIQRIGAFENCKRSKGLVRVLEKWKSIYKNAHEYVFDIIYELPPDLTAPLVKRVKSGVKFHHIISENATVPKGRQKFLQGLGFYELLEKGMIERRMKIRVQVGLVMNEKEALVMFPTKKGDPDLTEMFYGSDPNFHEWCVDYFRYFWNISDSFREYKLKN